MFIYHTAGADYAETVQSLVFPAGTSSGAYLCVSIPIINDGIAETNQSFSVILTSPSPDVLTVSENGGQTTVTIIDDEGLWAVIAIIL